MNANSSKKSTDILFINPPSAFGAYKSTKVEVFRQVFPLLSFMSLSAFVKKHNFTTAVLDLGIENSPYELLTERLREMSPKFVGITSTTPLFFEAAEIAKISRETLGQNVKIIYGGPHGSLYLVLDVKSHQYFQRRENDILLNLDINVAQAVLGAEVLAPTLDGVRRNLLNDVLWPDFTRIPSSAFPTLLYREVPEDGPFELAGYTITAIRVNHVVECVAYFIQSRGGTLLHIGDTGPTEAVWRHARAVPRLLAVSVETTFPNRLQEVADVSGHLTPQGLDKELEKLGRDVPVYVYHLKPNFRREILAELKRLRRPALHILEDGTLYRL